MSEDDSNFVVGESESDFSSEKEIFQQDARSAQEACGGGTGECRARVHNNSRAGVWRQSKRGSKLNCGNHRASRAEAAVHPVTIVARAHQA